MKNNSPENRFDRIGEIAYWIMLIFQIVLIGVATIVTAIIRKITGTEIVLIPKEILDYSLEIFKIIVIPISVKIAGKSGVEMLRAYRGKDKPINEKEEAKDD